MMRLTLKDREQVRSTIPRYQRFLEANELSVLERQEGKGTIELIINARLFGQVKWATKLAYDFFESAVIGINTESGELQQRKNQPSQAN